MAAKPTVIVTGVKEVDRALAALEPKLQKKAIRPALRKTAKTVAETAKTLAPVGSLVDGSDNPGELKRSIKVRAARASTSRTRKDIAKGRIGALVVAGSDTKGDKAWYSKFQELGTKYIEVEVPFLRTALYRHRATAHRTFVQALKAEISRVKAKGK